jgi:hypothetical protein
MSDAKTIQEELCRTLCADVSLRPASDGSFLVSTPFSFPDGDAYSIYMSPLPTGGWRLSDRGNTFMRLSYEQDVDRIRDGARQRIFEQILSEMDLSDDAGELYVEARADRLGESVFRFGQALTRVHDLSFLNRVQVENTFFEDLADRLESIVGAERVVRDFIAPGVPNADKYPADFAITGPSTRPVLLVFGVTSGGRARLATIVIQHLQQHEFNFRSLVVYSDMTAIPKNDLTRLTTVANDQIPSLSESAAIERKIADATF